MIHFITSLFFMFTVAEATEFFVADTMLGEFQYSLGQSEDNKYLSCENGVVITGDEDSLTLTGAADFEIEFTGINGKTIGGGYLFDYTQRRTRVVENNETNTMIVSEHRQCTPGLGALGCVGKKWRTVKSLKYTDSADGISVTIEYQPFSQTPVETCSFKK